MDNTEIRQLIARSAGDVRQGMHSILLNPSPVPRPDKSRGWRETMVNITEKSKDVFTRFANDAGNWAGMPLIGGNVDITKEERGNLTQLKKEGLIRTEYDSLERLTWVCFTENGERYAIELGICLGHPELAINWAHFHSAGDMLYAHS